jgi:plastocyanin
MGVKGKRRSMTVGLAGLAAGLLTGTAQAGDGSGNDTPYATIEFRADKTTAAVGETVTWEVWADWGVRRGGHRGSFFRGFTGALLANPRR